MLKRMASALGWAKESATARAADANRRLHEASEREMAGRAGPAPHREQIVALLVPESGENTFRLRAVPDAEARPDDVPDGAGSIYRTRDGRIVLDWHRAS